MITKTELNEGRMIAKLPMTPWQKRRIVKLYLMMDDILNNQQIIEAIKYMQVIQQLLPQAKEHFTNN